MWFDSHDTFWMFWSDDTKIFSVSGPPSRRKRVVICHAGSSESFLENTLLLCGKKLSELYLDYSNDFNGIVFEEWFESTLIPNLSKERKIAIVMDNAKYICIIHIFHQKDTNHEHGKGWNDCLCVKTQYWNSESNFNKTGVIGKDSRKK